MMTEYIDREALETKLNERLAYLREKNGYYDHYTDGYDEAVDKVEDFPAADVMPVVRCKACIYYVSEDGYLPYCACPDGGIRDYPQKMDYCSYGRKNDELD